MFYSDHHHVRFDRPLLSDPLSVGGAFSTGGGQVGGKEFVVISLVMFMLNNRMVVAGPLYRDEKTGSVWAETGAAAVTGPVEPGVGEHELDGARRLRERVAD